jgi:anti-repressor protein
VLTQDKDSQGCSVWIFEDHEVRSVLIEGAPWWVAGDVAGVLGIGRAQEVTRYLDDDEFQGCLVDTPFGGCQETSVISESGLYSVIMRSRKPDAKRFKRWVTHEVLPSIRMTGSYMLCGPDVVETTEIATVGAQVAQLQRTVDTLAAMVRDTAGQGTGAQVAQLQRTVEKLQIEAAPAPAEIGSYSLKQTASILCGIEGLAMGSKADGTGQNILMRYLRDFRLVDRTDAPYSNHSSHIILRARSYLHPRTKDITTAKPQVRITPLGIRYLAKRLGGHRVVVSDLPAPDDADGATA